MECGIWGKVVMRFIVSLYIVAGLISLSMIVTHVINKEPSRVDDVYNKIQSGYTVIVDGTVVKSGVTKDMIRTGIDGKTYFVDDKGKQVIVSLGR